MERFEEIEQLVAAAGTPAAVFGPLGSPAERDLQRRYHALLAVVHPDRNRDRPGRAHAVAVALGEWYARAQAQLASGAYGRAAGPIITAGQRRYVCAADPTAGDLCDLWAAEAAGEPVLLKVVRQPRDNDLLAAEAAALTTLAQQLAGQRVLAHFPRLVDQLTLRDAAGSHRAVNVLAAERGVHSLADVISMRPHGVPPQDMAWIFNRLLAALGTAHSLGLIHGAVVPEHLLIRPADHNGILVDWCYSVAAGGIVKAISPGNAALYPPEVLERAPATPATDLFMAAACMARLLGGDSAGEVPAHVPAPVRRLLAACLLRSPHRRAASAWQVFDDFREILHQLYGPPVFRHFELAS